MATFPALAVNPGGMFGKSMSAAPVNPAAATICTVTGRVLFCVTGCGAVDVVAGVSTRLKSGCKERLTLLVTVVSPVVSRPVITRVKGVAPVAPAGGASGPNTVKLTLADGPDGFGVKVAVIGWFPACPCAVKLMDPVKPPTGTTVNDPVIDPPTASSVLDREMLVIWKDGVVGEPRANTQEPTLTPEVLSPPGQLTTAA